MKNYGLDLKKERADAKEEDWQYLGASRSVPCIAQIPTFKRYKYLPDGEVQRGKEDMMDCATRSVLNILETKFNFLSKENKLKHKAWLQKNGYYNKDGEIEFSDAFIAILSDTTRQGNSLIAPIRAVRKYGLIPKHLLPLVKSMTWEEYHNPDRITDKMVDLGAEFSRRFEINYEKVYEEKYKELLEGDLLDVGGFAWTEPKNGEYPKSPYSANHAFILFDLPTFCAFDNYIDQVDGDYIKKLAPDYDFLDYGYRIYISEEKEVKNWLPDLIHRFYDFLSFIVKKLLKCLGKNFSGQRTI